MLQNSAGDGLWTSFGAALRLLVGWFSVAIGLLDLLVDADRVIDEPDPAYLLFHAMLLAGGLVLLAGTGPGRGPGVAGYVTGAVVAVGGLVAGAVRATNTVCCLSAYDERHGFPFSLAARDDGGRWHLDTPHLLADVLFWAYAGLLAMAAVALLRRLRPGPAAPAASPPPPARPHGEARAHALERARREQPAGD